MISRPTVFEKRVLQGFVQGYNIHKKRDNAQTREGYFRNYFGLDVEGGERFSNIAKRFRQLLQKSGWFKNVKIPIKSNPPMTLVYPRLLEIWASKQGVEHNCDSACKRANHVFRHKFKTQPRVYGLANGNLLIKS